MIRWARIQLGTFGAWLMQITGNQPSRNPVYMLGSWLYERNEVYEIPCNGGPALQCGWEDER